MPTQGRDYSNLKKATCEAEGRALTLVQQHRVCIQQIGQQVLHAAQVEAHDSRSHGWCI
jgi:hypothetical protein